MSKHVYDTCDGDRQLLHYTEPPRGNAINDVSATDGAVFVSLIVVVAAACALIDVAGLSFSLRVWSPLDDTTD